MEDLPKDILIDLYLRIMDNNNKLIKLKERNDFVVSIVNREFDKGIKILKCPHDFCKHFYVVFLNDHETSIDIFGYSDCNTIYYRHEFYHAFSSQQNCYVNRFDRNTSTITGFVCEKCNTWYCRDHIGDALLPCKICVF
jgi:hypothetical protein